MGIGKDFVNYCNLEKKDKIKYLNKHGNHVSDRIFIRYQIKLYHVSQGNYFVEVWFDEENQIFNVFPFTTTKCLKPYIDLVNINEIINHI